MCPASEVLKCPVCGGEKIKFLFGLDKRIAKDRFSIAICGECGIAWTNPLPDKGELAAFYPSSYHGSVGEERFISSVEFLVRLSRGKRAKEIEKLASATRGKILDIGCGRGWMLGYLKERGWETYGTELSSDSSYFAREHLKLNVLTKNIEDCSFPSQYFDAVTLWHTLEHLPQSPLSILKEISRIMKVGGLLIIEVPNFGGLQAGLFKNKWFHLDSPRHLYHFDIATLKGCLEKTGFRVIKFQNYSWQYDLFGFVQSMLNIFCPRFDYLYNLLRNREEKRTRKGQLDIIVTIVITPLLLPVAVIVASLSPFFRMGGILRYYCVKTAENENTL